MIVRTIVCGVCYETAREKSEGAGFDGWGQASGFVLEGMPNPHLCPRHLADTADFLDRLRDKCVNYSE